VRDKLRFFSLLLLPSSQCYKSLEHRLILGGTVSHLTSPGSLNLHETASTIVIVRRSELRGVRGFYHRLGSLIRNKI